MFGTAEASEPDLDVEFDPGFFTNAAVTEADLSRFSRPNAVLPGRYRVELLVNGERKQTSEIQFVQDADGVSTHPCLSNSLLRTLGLSESASGSAEVGADNGDHCLPVQTRLAGVRTNFDLADQTLNIVIPQQMLERRPRGYVDPALWDYGVNAALFGYRFNSYLSRSHGMTNTNSYLAMDTGINLGKWRFRHSSSVSFGNDRRSFNSIRGYAQRDLPALKSQLTIGDTYTDGRQLDSYRIRGLTLSTDDRMSPNSQTGYAPIVQGVAETNARVVITQRGTELYQMSVAPGPFVIDDLYATGYGGDLLVEIHEADGRVRSFTVPYSATPNILRKGHSRYAISAGVFNEQHAAERPGVAQATFAHGMTNTMTGYAGTAFSEGYASLQVGAAYNTPLGAVSFDVTGARARLTQSDVRSGRSVQVRYSKNFAEQGTTFALGAYRYSTEGYLGLADTIRIRDALAAGYDAESLDRLRSRFDMTLNQSLGRRGGSLYANASAQSYWNTRRDTKSYTVGYSNFVGPMTLGLTAQRSMIAGPDGRSTRDTMYQLNVSMPLGPKARAPVLTATLAHASERGNDARIGLNGSVGDDGQLHYNVAGTASERGSGQVSGGIDYMTSVAQLSAGASVSSGYRTANVGASGGAVMHPKGVTFSQFLGETVAVVEAQGAEGAKVSNATGVRIGKRGFAVVPYLSPYIKNSVDISPVGATLDVEFDETSKSVVPTLGSVLLLDYRSKAGEAMMIEVVNELGAPLPFGADVLNQEGVVVGVVGQASTIFINRAESDMRYEVKWGVGEQQRCALHLPDVITRAAGEMYTRLKTSCSRPNEGVGIPEFAAAP